MNTCERSEELRDYAFDELPAGARSSVERHLATCPGCAAELDGLRLTTAALRILPDREIPQRIAFVSDKVFKPSRFWDSAPRLGFASACVLAVGLIVSAWHRPAADLAQIRAEDARIMQAALAASDLKHEEEHRQLMMAMEDNLTILQKRYNTLTMLAWNGPSQ